jgi:aspartate kinase
MSVIVQKYGGSSVADVQKIGLVADRVVAAKREGHDVVVVVSAMGKTTDELIGLARRAAETATAGAEPPRRELDMLVSTGERVTMALLSIAIHARGHDAISFTGSQSGILTNDRHFDARIIEVRPHRIQDELSRGRIVIVAGYQGMSYKREITTLGRGGSDTTAVALAAALAAERCEIYSDVDGVYSADPRVVGDPRHLPDMDLSMLGEMAEAGAKVLNAQAVEWARRAKIAIYARKTSDPVDADGAPARQTIARDGGPSEMAQHRVRAVVGLDRVVVLHVAEPLRRFAEVAASMDLPLLDLTAGATGASAVVPLLNLPDWEACRTRLTSELRSLEIIEGRALVSIVGAELSGASALPKFLATLDSAGATPSTVVAGPLRIAATIASPDLAAAQRALHAAFV